MSSHGATPKDKMPGSPVADTAVLAQITLPHGLQELDPMIGIMRDFLARDLLNWTVLIQRVSDKLSLSSEPTAAGDLDRLTKWLHAMNQQAQEIMSELALVCACLPEDRRFAPHASGVVAPSPPWADTGAPSLVSWEALYDHLVSRFHNAWRPCDSDSVSLAAQRGIPHYLRVSKLYQNWIKSDVSLQTDLPEHALVEGQITRTIREQERVTLPEAIEMCELIMQHQRAPGDTQIQEKGCVIATYTPSLIKEDLDDKNQLIICCREEVTIGVSFFNPPESCPSWLKDANEYYHGTKNGTLSLILVDPTVQGKGVFEMLMNATMCSLAATGATHIVGWVEHTNLRAIKAYKRLGGEVSEECTHESTAPNGATTIFKAFRIPIRGLQEIQRDGEGARC